jgi:nitrous oxidase accessory protein NosD
MPARCLFLLLFMLTSAHALTSAELQQFIDDAAKSDKGSEVVIPPGRHVLDKPLVVRDAKKIRLTGLDAETTVLMASEGMQHVLELRGDCAQVWISKLTMDGAGFLAEKSGTLRIERCFFQNTRGTAITLQGCKEATITGCTVRDGASTAIELAKDSTECVVRHCNVARCKLGVLLQGVKNCRVEQNDFLECAEATREENGAAKNRIEQNESR